MPTIIDLRPLTNAARHITLIVVYVVMCIIGVAGCHSDLSEETCSDKPTWTTVLGKNTYRETINSQEHTVYELTLRADGRTNDFKLRVDKPTYDRAFVNNKPNRLNFNLNRSDYGSGWEPLFVVLCILLMLAGGIFAIVECVRYIIDINDHLTLWRS